jgi:hypothetical protein
MSGHRARLTGGEVGSGVNPASGEDEIDLTALAAPLKPAFSGIADGRSRTSSLYIPGFVR